MSRRDVNVVIIDKMQDDFISSRVGEIIEVEGAKIATINKETPDNSDCIVKGKDRAVQKIAKLFKCKEVSQNLTENATIEIILGQNFKKRF